MSEAGRPKRFVTRSDQENKFVLVWAETVTAGSFVRTTAVRRRTPEVNAMALTSGVLRLTAVVRTNDPAVTVSAQTSTNLFSWSDLVTNRFGLPASDTNGVPAGCQRRVFETPIQEEPRKFLKLKVISQ